MDPSCSNAYDSLQRAANLLNLMYSLAKDSLPRAYQQVISLATTDLGVLAAAKKGPPDTAQSLEARRLVIEGLSIDILPCATIALRQMHATTLAALHEHRSTGWPVTAKEFAAVNTHAPYVKELERLLSPNPKKADLPMWFALYKMLKNAQNVPKAIAAKKNAFYPVARIVIRQRLERRTARLLALNGKLLPLGKIYSASYMEQAYDLLREARALLKKGKDQAAQLDHTFAKQSPIDWVTCLSLKDEIEKICKSIDGKLVSLSRWQTTGSKQHFAALKGAEAALAKAPSTEVDANDDKYFDCHDRIQVFAARLLGLLDSDKPRPSPQAELEQVICLEKLAWQLTLVFVKAQTAGFDFAAATRAAIVPGFERIFK